MENLEHLASTAPDKLVELEALHWFTCAENICYDEIVVDDAGVAKEERPDFRLRIGDKIIGVEITLAQRPIADSKFSAHEIEAAQNKFARDLEQSIHPALPILVHLPFNDEIAVTPREAKDALSTIVDKIDKLTQNMQLRSGSMLVRSADDLLHYPDAEILAEIPNFLQNIQIWNEGQNFSAVMSSRGGIIGHFSEAHLLPILEKKHNSLKSYRTCSEQWLVIVSGSIPPIILPKERPSLLLASAATNFADAEIARPIQSDFDRVYFFRSPTHAVDLTKAP